MSDEVKRTRADEAIHERARMLAAESVDATLRPVDAQWLEDHLGTCSECAAVAQEYRAIHDELRSLAVPEPPRDLWARTSAAFDRVDAAGGPRSHGTGATVRPSRWPVVSTAVAVGFVVVVAAASLLGQSPIAAPAPGHSPGAAVALGTVPASSKSSNPQAPVAVVDGTTYWITADAGVYKIKSATTQCPITGPSCSVAGGTGQTLGSIASTTPVSAVIAPGAGRAAVWTDSKVAILPLATQSQTVTLDSMTPRPTVAATPTLEPTPIATATPTAEVKPTPEGTPAAEVKPTRKATATPKAETATPVPTRTTTASAIGTAPASEASPPAATAEQPIVILSGYEIVGHDPAFSADGNLVAFAARPVDHSTGPDVFVWRAGQEQAARVTFRHADLFAGWYGRQILLSEISAGQTSGAPTTTTSSGADTVGSTSYMLDPNTGAVLEIDRPMLLPTVDPTGKYLIYWSGAVEFDPSTGLWQPGQGDLYFDSWSDLNLMPASLQPVSTTVASAIPVPETASPELTAEPTATLGSSPAVVDTAATSSEPNPATPSPSEPAPTPSPAPAAVPQLLSASATPSTVHSWVVRWDATGQHVAIWVADPGSARIGTLELFSIDRTTGLVDSKLLAVDKVMGSIAFDDGRLIYTSAVNGKTYVQVVPSMGPSTVQTPSPTVPGQLPASGSALPTPPASGRPGD
jgi:hypothetical protein